MSKTVYCSHCLKEINVRDDLVTATDTMVVEPFHTDCYGKNLKGSNTLSISNEPLNGFWGNFIFIAAILAFLYFILFSDTIMKWYACVFLIPVAYRIYSYLVFERHVEK